MCIIHDAVDSVPRKPVEYPDSDGLPMADNTEHFEFIQTFQGNLNGAIPDFVAGDHLWYPVEGEPDTRMAPDVYVALGRPKGYRGSYKQWEEEDIPPRIVFEWWSPRTTLWHIANKLKFYERHGVEEFYTFNQDTRELTAFLRQGRDLLASDASGGITSPLLGIRLEVIDGQLKAWHRDGRPFLTWGELESRSQRAEHERQQALDEVAALRARLRDLGIEL